MVGKKTVASAFALACMTSLVIADDHLSTFASMVDADGKISMPETDFRANWSVLGTWAINGDNNEATGLHVVYTQPWVIGAYRETGKFPDGAVLIKELLNAQTSDYTTGHVSYAKDVTGWFVMVKDTQKRFKGNKLWGSGWGWAYFDPSDMQNATTTSYRSECMGCHIPARKKDWIFTEAYPVLKK